MNIFSVWFARKKVNFVYFFSYLVASIVSYVIHNIYFRHPFISAFSEAVFWLAVSITVFSFIALMAKKEVFTKWAKFSLVYFFASLMVVFFTPTSTHGLDFVPIVKETVTIFLAGLYSVISLVLISYSSYKKS